MDADPGPRGEGARDEVIELHPRSGRPRGPTGDKPARLEFGTPLEVFEQALEQEQKVTAQVNELYGLAAGENDYASQAFLQWFVTEQIEEEKNVRDVLETLNMVGDESEALFLLDRELGGSGRNEE